MVCFDLSIDVFIRFDQESSNRELRKADKGFVKLQRSRTDKASACTHCTHSIVRQDAGYHRLSVRIILVALPYTPQSELNITSEGGRGL